MNTVPMIVRPVVCRTLIGRREELAFLNEQRLRAAKSNGGMVVIAGEAGIGKSRLLTEFCRTLVRSRWRIGYGTNVEHAQRPYGPVLDVLSAFDPNATAEALLPAATKREQFDAIAARFTSAAAKNSLIAVIEDLHWADAATLELLAFLAPDFLRLRILVLASLRLHDLPETSPLIVALEKLMRTARASRVDLGPLDEPALRNFIDEALIGHALPEQSRRAVARTSEGNPFFAEELLRFALERRALEGAAGTTNAELPSSIRATLLQRWHTLDAADRRILAQAAVIGRQFDLALLAQTLATEIDVLLPTLARAREIQLVEELGPTLFRFRHALTRTAIYAGFLDAHVKRLHRSIATVLEDAPPARRSLEGLAYHWWAAGDGKRGALYNELAGDAAGDVHAHADAIAAFERALESSELTTRARATIVEKIAQRCVALAFADRAHEEYGRAADLFARANDDEAEARCRVPAAITAYTTGIPEPIAPLMKMLERLDEDAYAARARVHLGIAWLAATFWYPTQAAKHIAQIDERALGITDLALRYHNVSAWIAMTMNDLATFRREHAAWIETARRDGGFGVLASAHYNGASCYSIFGLHDEAFEQIEQAFAVARAEKNQHGEESTHAIAAICYFMSGDLQRARTALDAVPPTTDNLVTLANAVACGTLVGAHLDDRDLLTRWFDAAGEAMFHIPDEASGAGLAAILAQRGKLVEARGVLHRAIVDCERPRGNALTLLAAAKLGAPEDAERARVLLAAAADASGDSLERSALALFDAYADHRAGRHEDAARNARIAAEGFERLGFPLFEAAARESAGERGRARTIYLMCGATHDARRLVDPSDGGAGTPAAAAAAAHKIADRVGFAALSAREFEIAMLVASGKSNVEIAANLAISHKTVEKHLGSTFQKLGLSSRAQLATFVTRRTAPDAQPGLLAT